MVERPMHSLMRLRKFRLFSPGLLILFCAADLSAQQAPPAPDPRVADFKKLSAQIVDQRKNGLDEKEDVQEQALKLLDAFVLEQLNRPGTADLAAINQRLASLRSGAESVGERFELVRLGATLTGAVYYALVVNFSLSGPSAVRFFPPSDSGYRLAAKIDRWEQPDYFDEYLELVPYPASDVVFVTVNGRTDELRSGTFAAWRFTEGHFVSLWSTDILERSAYELRPDGFHLSFCSQNDEKDPRICRKITRERYVWDSFSWRRVERQESDAPQP
jgi:hypothetical protein